MLNVLDEKALVFSSLFCTFVEGHTDQGAKYFYVA